MAELVAQMAASLTQGAPFVADAGGLDVSAACDLQDQVAALVTEPLGGRAGWKIAWNTDALQAKFGMPHPGMGRVFGNFVYGANAVLPHAGFTDFMMEIEIIARLGSDIGPGNADRARVEAAIAGYTAGFELLDRRGATATATADAILAQNVFNAGAVLGETWIAPGDLDTDTLHTIMTHDGETVVDGVGMAPQHPVDAITFLAQHYTARGEIMKAGEFILCGSHIPLYPMSKPGKLEVSLGNLGEISLTLT